MKKADLVKAIAENTGIETEAVSAVVENFMIEIKNSVANGDNVYLRKFATFKTVRRAEKTARNISKNESIVIPAHNTIAVKPSPFFVKQVRGY